MESSYVLLCFCLYIAWIILSFLFFFFIFLFFFFFVHPVFRGMHQGSLFLPSFSHESLLAFSPPLLLEGNRLAHMLFINFQHAISFRLLS